MIAIAVALSYLLGGIPFALVAGRIKGVDLRAHGSGNLGATNAIRVLGKGLGIPVLLLDVLKGVIAAAAIPALLGPFEETGRLVCGAAAVAGHIFSPFLRFRGGKGVATAGGAFLALAPAATGIAFAVFLLVLLIGRIVSLASVLAAVALPIALASLDASRLLLGAGIVIATLVVFRHRGNLRRLREGTESRIGGRRRAVVSRAGVLGAGSWGTALAALLAGKGVDTVLWARSEEAAERIRTSRENARYLPGVSLPESLQVTADATSLSGRDLILAVPTKAQREVARALAAPSGAQRVLCAAKGYEPGSRARMSVVLREELGPDVGRSRSWPARATRRRWPAASPRRWLWRARRRSPPRRSRNSC